MKDRIQSVLSVLVLKKSWTNFE